MLVYRPSSWCGNNQTPADGFTLPISHKPAVASSHPLGNTGLMSVLAPSRLKQAFFFFFPQDTKAGPSPSPVNPSCSRPKRLPAPSLLDLEGPGWKDAPRCPLLIALS